jgi:osmotically-inducible protein OsmY
MTDYWRYERRNWPDSHARYRRQGETGGWADRHQDRLNRDHGLGEDPFGRGYAAQSNPGGSGMGLGLGYRAGGFSGFGGEDWPGGQDLPGRQFGGSWGESSRHAQYRHAPDRDWFSRASDEVSSWLGDEEAQRRRQVDHRMGGHYGKGPKGYSRSDERIKEDVSDRLTDDWMIDASDVEVQVSSREVTLNGTVRSREEKWRAEDVAEQVSGVRHVQNNLRIAQSSSGRSGSVDRPGFDLGGASAEGRRGGPKTTFPGPRS